MHLLLEFIIEEIICHISKDIMIMILKLMMELELETLILMEQNCLLIDYKIIF